MKDSATTARLLITCPDRPGIVAAVSGFLHAHGANITALDQHSTDPEGGTFFMRLEFQTPHLDLSRAALERSFADVVARRFDMGWALTYSAQPKRMALLVSRREHALLELLWRVSREELPAELIAVISNHPDLERKCAPFGVPFHHVPFDRETREAAEARLLELVNGSDGKADLLVLARFMQVLSPAFVARFPARIINIHHSFLPAFSGASPYRQAYERGVKRIGATAHYVTEALDEGPIIEQDVLAVSHRHSAADLEDLGRDIERQVLARAVKWHLEDRVIVHGNKTVVFA
jgi:formyltetrahydrofolate deformylase